MKAIGLVEVKNVARGIITQDDLEYRLEGLKNAYLYVREEA